MGITAVRTVRFLRSAVRYWLVPSVRSVTITDLSGGDGTPVPASVTCRILRQMGEDSPTTVDNPGAEGLSLTFFITDQDGISTTPSICTGAVTAPTNPRWRSICFTLSREGRAIDTATIAILTDGAPGTPGTPGQDAIGITVTPQTLTVKRGTTLRQKVYVDLFRGATRVNYSDPADGDMKCSTLSQSGHYITESIYWNFGTDNGRFYYLIVCSGTADENIDIPFTVTYGSLTFSRAISVRTISDGSRGPALRGPQFWKDCPQGFPFQAGGDTDMFQDIVIHNDTYYACRVSHLKTATNYPGSNLDKTNGYWQASPDFDIVATKILLATYALVKNLGVECIDMKDADGNILFQAKDGNVTCRTGTFENIVMSGLMRKKRFEVTAANFSDIFKPDPLSAGINPGDYIINFAKCGTWLDLRYLPGIINLYPDSMRSLTGNTILIYNNTSYEFGISSWACNKYDGSPGDFHSFSVKPGEFVSLECKIGAKDGKEVAYFLYQKGTIDTTIDT